MIICSDPITSCSQQRYFYIIIILVIIIRLEARLRPNIGFTSSLAVFTRSVVTPPKVNRFGRNLEHYEHIVGAGRFWV